MEDAANYLPPVWFCDMDSFYGHCGSCVAATHPKTLIGTFAIRGVAGPERRRATEIGAHPTTALPDLSRGVIRYIPPVRIPAPFPYIP